MVVFGRARSGRRWSWLSMVLHPAGWLALCMSLAQAHGQLLNRVPRSVDTGETVPLPGSVTPLARTENENGRLSADTRLSGVTIYFKLTRQQRSDLDALVSSQQREGSPQFHKWLTPGEYASRFGLSPSDLDTIENWLETQGFQIDRVAKSRNSISFSGTVGQLESTFRTEIHRYRVAGETHFANATELAIPSSLAGVIEGVRNLNDFRPKPLVRFHHPAPNFTSSQSGNHFLTPKDVATIYDVNAAYNSGYNGTGQSIAVVGQSEIDLADIEHFQSAAGLTVKDPTVVLVPGSGTAQYSSGDEAESDLDLEYSGGMGTGATIYFVYVGNNQNYSVFDSIQYAVDNRIAPIITVSYGSCEADLTASDFSTLESIMEQGASQGQSIISASGDQGSTSCYGDKSLTTAEQEALAVSYPASSAYVTGLGGTEFPASDVSSSNSTYWQSAGGSDVISTAKSYIPEQTWNDDSSQYGLSASGGGVSALTGRPSWQKGVTGIASGNYRLVPDISLDSSPDNAGYLYCSSDTSAWSQGQQASCNSGFRDSSTESLTVAGGTSFAAPIFAGLLAILGQKENASGQGLINSTLYTLASNASTYASAFHDITSGGNQCTAGSQYCSSQGESEYGATTGYDLATGLGSIDFYNLLTAWTSSSSGLDSTVTSLSAATSTPAYGANDTVTIKVSPESQSVTATPTGTLSITVDGTTVDASLALANGAATYTFSSTVAGAHVIVAAYSGDSTFASSTGSLTVTVGSSGGGSGAAFTLSATNVTVAQGSSGTSTITVTSENSYAGTVTFKLSTTSASLEDNGCYEVPDAAVTANKTATTALTIYTAKSSCSSSFLRKGSRRLFRAGSGASNRRRPFGNAAIPLSAGAVFTGFMLIGTGRRRTWLKGGLLFLLLVASVDLANSCAGNGNNEVVKGTYTLTLDGQDKSNSSITASTTFTLTVD